MMDVRSLLLYLIFTYSTEMSSYANEDSSIQGLPQEYCLAETFRPKCSRREVILMESAIYGRMQTGKCIKAKEIEGFEEDPRFLGCSVDVLSLIDEQCSGKPECNIRVIDISDDNRQPCLSDLKLYLEASYRCINVVDENRSCSVAVSGTPVHVDITKSVICGRDPQPWTIEAPVGQRIVVSLINLTLPESHKTKDNQCQQYGFIVDGDAKRSISLCEGGQQREKQLHSSKGNAVEVILNHQTHSAEAPRKLPVLLKFEAVGCSDIVPSEDNWLKRRDDVIVIGCYSSRQTWQLNCIAGKWVGVIGNCSKEMSESDHFQEAEEEEEPRISGKAEVLAIVSICGFTLAICFIIVCIGALCLRRYYIQNKSKSDYRTLNYESDFGRSKEMTGQKTSSAFPTHRTGDAVNGSLAHHLPAYSVYLGQNAVESADNHHDQINA